MMRAPRKILILLDALDECSERRELLKWLGEFIPTLTHVQLIATGRPEDPFERLFNRGYD